MRKACTTWTGICFLLFLFVTLGMPLSVSAKSKKKSGNPTGVPPGQPFQALQSQIDALSAQVGYLQGQLAAAQNAIQNLLAWQQPVSQCLSANGPDVIVEECNLHIVNGLGQTNTTNGVGNLIIGYNETGGSSIPRNGSHNLIIGPEHAFSSYGGLVVGAANEISGPYASVCGGEDNVAKGLAAAVSGGRGNLASGQDAVVSGGNENIASGNAATVSGSASQTASTPSSLVP